MSLDDRNIEKLDISVVSECKNPKVSIIVPCYNVEKYIEKCLNSLVQQTLKKIEIICIDDGSSDATLEIIKKYSENDKRVKVLLQEHKRQGAARNKGMEIALGEYVGFIDSDDWIDLDYYEKLYNAAKKYDSDIALADYIRTGNGKTKIRLNIQDEKLYTDLNDKFEICKQAKHPCPTNKIYRTEMLKRENIVFPEGVFSEDKIFTCKAVYYANSVISVPNTYYYYFRRPNSTVKTKNKANDKDKQVANRVVLEFLRGKNVKLDKNDFWAVKKEYSLFGVCLYLIKESLKNKLLEIGAKISDETPFSRYAEFIKNTEKTVFTDSTLGSMHRKDSTSILAADNYDISSDRKSVV